MTALAGGSDQPSIVSGLTEYGHRTDVPLQTQCRVQFTSTLFDTAVQ